MTLALDSSVRTYDNDGRLHILKSHISKACVNPYYGREIPGSEALGLDPNRVYYLLRSPAELAKAAPSFARLPILKEHVPVTAEEPQPELIVGSIGSDVDFLAPYLDADTCIWDATAIAGIETETVKEFSCAYHYIAVMTSGTYLGEHYDGIMTEIKGNHLALVESGRAGSEVMAADRSLIIMKQTKLGKALIAAFSVASPKKLALDSSLPTLLGQVTKKNFDKAGITAKLIAIDAEMKPEACDAVMDAIMDVDNDPNPAQDEETPAEKEAREKKEKAAKDKAAKDEAEKDDKEKEAAKDKAAKDAKESDEKVTKAMDSFRIELRDAEDARRAVRPVVGEIIAQDSAAEIYTFALDHLKVDHQGVTEVAGLKALYTLASKAQAPAPRVAQDSAGLAAKFPNASRFRQG